MSYCGSPPGLGVEPSVFPTKKVYDTFDVTYTSVDGVDRPSEVVYYDTAAVELVTVTITYDGNFDPIWNGVTLKNHDFNVFKASFELIPPSATTNVTVEDDVATAGPSAQSAKSLTDATVVELIVGGSALSGRKLITLQCTTSNVYLWFGDSGNPAPSVATVTTDGLTLFKNAKETYEAVANQPVYAVSVVSAASLILIERA